MRIERGEKTVVGTGDGLLFLKRVRADKATVCVFDPQYRSGLDKLAYGNEGARQIGRAELKPMTGEDIDAWLAEIYRVLKPSGYVLFWVDKFELLNGAAERLRRANLEPVDLITWNKVKLGMGYRTRRQSEYLIVGQKAPRKAKATWKRHDIPDVWTEAQDAKTHPHAKPWALTWLLLESITQANDLVVDPCAGSFLTARVAKTLNLRSFCCDLRPPPTSIIMSSRPSPVRISGKSVPSLLAAYGTRTHANANADCPSRFRRWLRLRRMARSSHQAAVAGHHV